MMNLVRIFLYIISLIACCIEVDISVPCFPNLVEYFETTTSSAQHTVSVNFLGFFIGSLIVGPLSDAYGRRPIMIIGNAILMLGALSCIWAPTISLLLIARFFQGIGASTSAVVVFAMIADVYKGNKATQIIGIMNGIFTVLIALSPIFGCFLNKNFGWRGNYAVVGFVCVLSFALIVSLLSETLKTKKNFFWKFFLKDISLLIMNKHFLQVSLIPSLLYASYLSFVTSASFLYMQTFKLPLFEYAMHQATIVACFSIVSMLSGSVLKYVSNLQCICVGINLCFFGISGFLLESILFPSAVLTTIFVSTFSIGFSLMYPIIFTDSLEIFPGIKGVAMSVIMSTRALVIAFMVFITGYFYNGNPKIVAWIMMCAVCVVGFLTFFYILKLKQGRRTNR